MSDTPVDNVVQIADAVKNAKPVKRREKAAASAPARVASTGSTSAAPDIGGGFYGPPDTLPDDAPVRALGKKGREYFFLDSIGQLIGLKASEIGRNDIMGLFGGDRYLINTWPEYNSKGEPLKHKWQHQKLSPILINACTSRGQWDPMDRVRGPGCWVEDDGQLIMHCGDVLYVGRERVGTGLRGSLLYPRGQRLPEPVFGAKSGPEGPGAPLLEMADTWNWARGDLDAKLFVGAIGCCILGAAADWRAQTWITGGPKSGKSTLQLLLRWTIGTNAIIKAENATPAGVSQVVGYSSLPVSLDELEAKANNHQVQEVIELMRIAASGGEKLRGGADGTPTKTQLKNCFIASSVLIPPLKPQDKSRMAILSLRPFNKEQIQRAAEITENVDEEADENSVLGRRERWAKIGCEIRGRLIAMWPRYRKTFRAYRRSLIRIGHDARAADQFGAIGAAYDCIMFDELTDAHTDAWAAMLPPDTLAETAEQLSEERECLAHLLSSMPDIFRASSKESVAYWLRMARTEVISDGEQEADQVARRTLAKIGIRIYRDRGDYEMQRLRRSAGESVKQRDDVLFWVAISHTHGELAKIFHGTHWKGEAGSAGTWAQALNRLPDAVFGPKTRKRIDGTLNYVTCLPWETVFPPIEDGEDADVADTDRVKK